MAQQEFTGLSPKQISQALKGLWARERVPLLHGNHGTGKTEIIRDTALEVFDMVVIENSVTYDPADFRFSIATKNGQIVIDDPEWMPPADKTGVLFWDEYTRAPNLTRNALYQLLLGRRIGRHELPAGWQQAAATNAAGTIGVNPLAEAEASRFAHLHLEPSIEDWQAWAAGVGLLSTTIAFTSWRPQRFNVFERHAYASPNPRAWVFVDGQIRYYAALPHMDWELLLTVCEGIVGREAAVERLAFEKVYRNLPNIDTILMHPDSAAVPSEPDVLYATACALAERADDANFGRVVTYLERLPSEHNLFAVSAATRQHKGGGCVCSHCQHAVAITHTSDYIDWVAKHPEFR